MTAEKDNHTDNKTDLNRRQFIRNTGAGAFAVGTMGVLSTNVSASDETTQKTKTSGVDYDVIVIGGGFAGVAAARDSRENGYSTLLLEARNRLGGRTFTAEYDGKHVELGGTWIHWTQPFVWAETERYGLELVETAGAVPDRFIMRLDGKTIDLDEEDFLAVLEAFQALTADAREVIPQPFALKKRWDKVLELDQVSVGARMAEMDLTPVQRAALDAVVASSAHNYAESWSVVDLLRWTALAGYNDFMLYMDASARYKHKEGTIALINAMIEDGKPDVRLSTPVKSIEDKGNKVIVTTQRGEKISAGAVICTVPLNVLPGIDFKPPLSSAVIEAGTTGHTGVGLKVFIKVKGSVGNVSCLGERGHPLPMLFTYDEHEDGTLLVSFPNDADLIDYYDEEAVQAALREYLPDAVVESVTHYDWVLDPYSKGTWAHFRPGWFSKYYDALGEDMGRILFGSGDYGEGWRGFIDGAIGGGSRAAERARRILG